ncbi:glycoside hydrolase family 15 protein [Prosthecomicrobium sp. N25]|uniref:glycoside hydrolase family 15 protein n=1 Tax=Prosthecomicrobium sp. N25 TaxID=3129254 RepID=UPI0030781338
MDGRSYFTLTTANGFNVTLVDARSGLPYAFLDHPYRYLRPVPDERHFGIERRNLLAGMAFAADGSPFGPVEQAGYVEETGMVRSRFAGGAELTVVAPFGLRANGALFVAEAAGAGRLTAEFAFHLGLPPVADPFWQSPFGVVRAGGSTVLRDLGPAARLQSGPGVGAFLHVPLGPTRFAAAGADRPETVSLESQAGTLAVLVVYLDDPALAPAAMAEVSRWLQDRDPAALLAAELSGWRDWRRPTPDWLQTAEERMVWRQSEAVLRMGQVAELAVDGMILAALPPGEWSIGWVRDGCYATVALAHAGYIEEARRSLDFYLRRGRAGRYRKWVGDVPYRISLTRYFGDGQEEADYAEHDTPNIELDGWGLVLWAAGEFLEASADIGWLAEQLGDASLYDVLEEEIARALAAQVEPDSLVVRADSSIWEVHQEHARHFLYTSATAARGLNDFARIAERFGRPAHAARYRSLARSVAAAIPVRFAGGPDGALLGARERSLETDVDGAVFELFALGVPADLEAPYALATYRHLEALRVPSGGYCRNLGPEAYGASEWGFVNLRVAGLSARRGHHDRARALLDLTTRRAAANFGLIAETYGVAPFEVPGRYTGSTPMVGYGAGLYLLAQMEVAGVLAPPEPVAG